MKVSQYLFKGGLWTSLEDQGVQTPNFILCFGNRLLIEEGSYFQYLRAQFPGTPIISCSSAGEISNTEITEKTVVATAVEFDHSQIQYNSVNLSDYPNSYEAGKSLMEGLSTEQLKFVLLLSDGQQINGSELVNGVNEVLQHQAPVAGGLAADSNRFEKTLLGVNEDIKEGNLIALGLYGAHLEVGFGSEGGWLQFGPERTLTKSAANVISEIDGKNALDLYRLYLGDEADDLKVNSFFYPISIQEKGIEYPIVRTILSIDEENKTMSFAGNTPQGSKVRLMKFNTDNLLDASTEAMIKSSSNLQNKNALSIMISCIGRKIVLDNRFEDELDAAKEGWDNPNVIFSGFYSYGEIAPYPGFVKCELHNQTMTITTITENI